jgi:hypothetical protein
MTTYTLRERLEANTIYLLTIPILPIINWMERASTSDSRNVPTLKEFYKDERENLLIKARQRTVARQKARRKADLPIDYC